MKKFTSILLAGCTLLLACNKGDLFEKSQYSLETSTRMARDLVAGAPDYFGHIKSDKVTNLSQGVSLLDLSYLNKNGYAMQLYLYKVVLGTATLAVALPPEGEKTAPVSVQAEALNGGTLVLGAVNGDAFSAKDKSPLGIVYRDGTGIKTTFSDDKAGFFATLKDGTAVIGDQDDYGTYRRSLQNAIGTRGRILEGGYPVPDTQNKAEARTFVAVSADGMTVWTGVVDGVYFYYSNGITLTDLATVLLAAGASDAALLDGGNVTTLVRRDDLGEQLFPVVNSPSDNGKAYDTANALAIIEN